MNKYLPINIENISIVLLIMSLFAFTTACFSISDQQGVDNLWREEANVENIEEDKTTQNEIIQLFGPPSQIISLENGAIFYYLLQDKKGKGIFLLLFNYKTERVSYDRAIFFFDNEGILTDYGFSVENVQRN